MNFIRNYSEASKQASKQANYNLNINYLSSTSAVWEGA